MIFMKRKVILRMMTIENPMRKKIKIGSAQVTQEKLSHSETNIKEDITEKN